MWLASLLGLLVLLIAEKSAFGGPLSAVSETCCHARLALAEFFHAGFVRFATEQPPIDVKQPRGVACPTTLLPQDKQIALFQFHDEFAPVATVAVFANSHAPDGFVERGHIPRSVCFGFTAALAESPSS